MTSSLTSTIAAECNHLRLAVDPDAMPRLAAYAERLWAWNEKLNLTRHTDAATFVARDVADAAAIVPHLAAGERVLDVGTGGGVPGIVLAILRPDLHVELCDSVGKKARAVQAISAEAGLPLPISYGRSRSSWSSDTLTSLSSLPLAARRMQQMRARWPSCPNSPAMATCIVYYGAPR